MYVYVVFTWFYKCIDSIYDDIEEAQAKVKEIWWDAELQSYYVITKNIDF